MKRLIFSIVILLMAIAPYQVLAQRGPGKHMRGWNKDSPYCMMFNTGKKMEIKGKIIEIKKFTPQTGASFGIEIVVETAPGNYDVHLGPEWFMKNQEMQLQVGDMVEVNGAMVDFEGRKVIMASEVERGEQEMKLREENGQPVWK